MARGFSKAIITGNITRDPDLKTLTTGTPVCSFTVAVNRVFRDSSGKQQESVSFIDCVAWGKLGEVIKQYAKKGTGILVSGRLDQRSWEDKTTGQRRSRVEIVVEDFNFISNGPIEKAGGHGDYQAQDGGYSIEQGSAEIVPEDVAEGEIDLSEVPF